jgi:hypothetical protein
VWTLEVALAFLDLHGAFLVVVDGAVGALGGAEGEEFGDDFGEGVGVGADGSGAGAAAEGAEAGFDHLGLLATARDEGLFRGQEGIAAEVHGALFGEVEIDDGDVFFVDVLPDVHLGPVGEGEDADGLAGVDAAVVEVPKFGALVLGVPLAGFVAEGVDALFGSGFFFVATRAAECGVETIVLEAVEQGLRFEEAAAALGVEGDGIGAGGEGGFVAPDEEFGADGAGHLVAEGEHLGELVAGVDVHEGEGNGAGEEGFLRETQHDGGVFADGVEHDGALELCGDLAEDVDAFGFQEAEVAEARRRCWRYRLRWGFAENR